MPKFNILSHSTVVLGILYYRDDSGGLWLNCCALSHSSTISITCSLDNHMHGSSDYGVRTCCSASITVIIVHVETICGA